MKAKRTTLIVEEYFNLVNTKLERIDEELELATRNRKLYETLILKSKDKVYPNTVLRVIEKHNTDYPYQYKTISDMYKGVERSQDKALDSQRICIARDEMILNYYKQFKTFATKEIALANKKVLYEDLAVSPKVVKFVFNRFFYHGARFILNGGKLMLPHNIMIRVKGKSRLKNIAKHGVSYKKKIDWHESYKTLRAIAEQHSDYTKEQGKKFDNKELTQKQFIDSMQGVVYNAKTNPTGIKWLVQDDKEFDFWLVWYTRFCSLKGIRDYAISPSKDVSGRVVKELGIPRKQSAFLETVTKVDDIIDTEYLGMIDKIAMLSKYDVNYCLKTFDNNIE